MKLSKTSALAALAMAHLAQQGQGVVQARQVAEHLGIPTDSALKILQSLARQRLIRSHLGRSGGYRLDREAGSVTLLEVVEAIDGPIDADLRLDAPAAGVEGRMDLLHSVCEHVAERVRCELAATSIADLAQRCEPAVAVAS